MSWASARTTTRAEDMAYSLLGIVGVNMPLMYGESVDAFRRLQEIIRRSPDHTIFCWGYSQDEVPHPYSSEYDPSLASLNPLALWPQCFRGADILRLGTAEDLYPDCQGIWSHCESNKKKAALRLASHYEMTNQGLRIQLPCQIIDAEFGTRLAVLSVTDPLGRALGLVLVPSGAFYANLYYRVPGSRPLTLPQTCSAPTVEVLYIQNSDFPNNISCPTTMGFSYLCFSVELECGPWTFRISDNSKRIG